MSSETLSSRLDRHWMFFTFAMTLIVVVYILYGVNMVRWRNSPDFGWRTMYDSGPNVVAEIFDKGEEAGLQVGDTIQAINGQAYSTFEELYFEIRHEQPGSVNTYTVLRDGKSVEISITTGSLGLRTVLLRSGPIYVIGLIYVIIGVLVFLMKPKAAESWLFLVMVCCWGMPISYSAPSDLMRPLWLFDIRRLIDVIIPAPLIHLALRFPRTRTFLLKRSWLWVVPYLVSFILFILFQMTSTAYWESSILDVVNNLYLLLGVLVFMVSMVWNFLKDTSVIIRLQCQVILLGIILGFFVPTGELLLRSFWGAYLFPDPALGFAFFLTAFPLSIGYTIVKHDLFAIDTFIKRTYGYVLTTGAIAGTYALFVLVSNLALGRFAVTSSPVFPLIFVLAVVFLFNPVRNRIQKFIDRAFYRLEYDYQETVQRISETMRSLLKLDEILKAITDIAVGAMYVDWGCVLLLNRENHAYECLAVAGEREQSLDTISPTSFMRVEQAPQTEALGPEGPAPAESFGVGPENRHARDLRRREEREGDARLAELNLPVDAPLIHKIAERGKQVTVYDIQADPFFEGERESCMKAFHRMRATLMVPLIYEDRLTGVISLGQKKSGKFYRREDINLLNTLANQGAVALENAMLLKEVIEKERMEEELGIARDLQMSMLPAICPEIEGFELAAVSVPARQVGGDFFDFIEIGEDTLGLVIADVAGKSVSGALVMAASRSVFRMLSEEELSVGEIMIRANQRTKKDIKRGMFVALLYAVLNARETSLSLCSAGQTQPIHLSAKTGEARLVETKGDTFPLGILEDARYQQTQLQLAAGDRVVFYTDGIVEAMNEQQEIFGFDRLLDVVREARSLTADSLLKEIIDRVNTFAGGTAQHDDMTVIVVGVAG